MLPNTSFCAVEGATTGKPLGRAEEDEGSVGLPSDVDAVAGEKLDQGVVTVGFRAKWGKQSSGSEQTQGQQQCENG